MIIKTKETVNIVVNPKEEFAYGYIIKALAGGLYPDKFHVIREYVQNAFDAIISLQLKKSKRKPIKIIIKKPSIFILDEGIGMDRHTLNEYRKVGFSKKKAGEAAGFRGIGKLAGISVAKKMIITTSPVGIPEKYKLTFDAESMIKEIDELKKNRENISLNELIEKHTGLTSDTEDKKAHYTLVELQGIRPESRLLFDKKKLINYLSKNTPVPFDPRFEQGVEIERDIKKWVTDYNCVDILVDDKKVYKPFLSKLKPFKHILIWDSKIKNKLIAYCWYCENAGKGQIKPIEISGLVYRHKNFAVGDNNLVRNTIWSSSSNLAFYFLGEIYLTDLEIIPTSQRDDFEHTKTRDSFYKKVNMEIANELNSLAHESSDIRKAQEYVIKGNEIISKIEEDLKEKDPILKELNSEKIAQIVKVAKDIQSREKNIPKKEIKMKKLAEAVLKRAKILINKIDDVKSLESEYSIEKKVSLNKQAKEVYDIAIRTIKDFLVNKPEEIEKIIKIFNKNLTRYFSENGKRVA